MIEQLALDALHTTFRWFVGLSSGAALAAMLFLSGEVFRPLRRPLSVAVDFLRSIPIIAMIVPFFIVFGVQEVGKFAMVAWATAFPIFVHLVREGTAAPQQKLMFEVGRLSRREMLVLVYFPIMMTALVGGIRIALGIGWISTVAAEMLGVPDNGPWAGGLGQRITRLTDVLDYSRIAIYLITFGLLGLGSARLYDRFVRTTARLFRLDVG